MKARACHPIAVLVIACSAIAHWSPSPSKAEDADEEWARERADYEARNGYMFYTLPEPDPPKRDLPNYSGQDRDPVTFEEGFLWIPRFILMPVYFVTEEVLRQGLGGGITKAEEKEISAKVVDAFKFGDKQQFTIFPIFSFDFGLRANIGVVSSFGDIPVKHTTLTASALFGGIDFVSGNIGVTWSPPGKKWSGALSVGASRRADGLFFGLGSEASKDNEARYNFVGYDVGVNYTVQPFRRGSISLDTGYRYRVFGDDVSGTTIPDLVIEGNISELPPAYPEGYSAWYLDPRITYDSRKPRPAPGSGVRLATGFNFGLDPVLGDTSTSWIVYGAGVRGFLDVSGYNHTFSLGAITIFSDGLRGEVPFTELPAISGNGPMPGFVGRVLAGDSAAALNLQFTWPIWLRLDGKVHFAVGNVFDGHLSNFAFEDLRMSFGGGIQAHGAEKTYFEFMVGGGTETFAQGPKVTSVRILFGVSRDY